MFLSAALAVAASAADLCSSTAAVVSARCVARLTNGFAIRHQGREVRGDTVRLSLSETGGYVELPASQIAAYESDDTPAAAAPAPPLTVDDHITRATDSTGIDSDFLRSVIRAESGGNAKARSPKGALGLMQLMPGTAAQLGVKDAYDAGENIQGGSQYLRELLVRYNGDAVKALAAYNAGPGRVKQYKGVPPYRETRRYVSRIIKDYNRRKSVKSPQQKKSRTLAVTATPDGSVAR